ncbi:20S proteasome A and B subunits [Segniliparus rotundus DSM 44985]|uniref:Proteasome subunit alpha n=1 Tax=Segniliparus rotundus (strain ATCC BAA-972 / CDC 1076 / CIP 108378 / DSM 44985 / JCM 13578) TaxID=640132 RepID=D6Z7Y4_SEGRD|nr:proteasome subunit alpha [Segniliparus rotundus]ADG98064.1 20S proteasome A and B subunits [Segniliparus rotundus DSM 44985]
MTFPFYAPAEQIMRDRAELARKGIGRGRSVVVLAYEGGVLLVAENPSSTLRKISELYDRIGFAAVGKYSEFEQLRRAGIRLADTQGYQFDRRDVTGRSLANAYAQALAGAFTEQPKPFEVELAVAEVGLPESTGPSQLYRISYDGSITDEREFIVMGGTADTITTTLKEKYVPNAGLGVALGVAIEALRQPAPTNGPGNSKPAEPRELGPADLEVAVLERSRPRRAFRRLGEAALAELLPASPSE